MGEHHFAPNLPLSEHTGDAPPESLAYFYVDDLDVIAEDFGAGIVTEPWGGRSS